MCGRFATRFNGDSLIRQLPLAASLLIRAELKPRYNIAPTQAIPALRAADSATCHLDLLRWGLVPHWSKGPDSRYAMHNARLEAVETKPAYRQAFARQRCLIPADGWYEWQARPQPAGKQACFIHTRRDTVFCFAGLWDHWRDPSGALLESCTIMTSAADSRLEAIHPRMPVVLDPQGYSSWLDPELTDSQTLKALVAAHLYTDFCVTPVSRHVNNAGNDDPRCVEPLAQDLPGG